MSWRLLKWFWRDPEPEEPAFVLVGRESTVFVNAPSDTLRVTTMSEQEYPTFPKAHDPDNVSARNLDIGWLLQKLGGAFSSASFTASAEVTTPPPATTPDDLVVSLVAYDTASKRVSFRISGGTRGVRYLITMRLVLTDGRSEDVSVWQLVRDR